MCFWIQKKILKTYNISWCNAQKHKYSFDPWRPKAQPVPGTVSQPCNLTNSLCPNVLYVELGLQFCKKVVSIFRQDSYCVCRWIHKVSAAGKQRISELFFNFLNALFTVNIKNL